MTKIGRPRPSPEVRFFSKVNKTKECWLWKGVKNKAAYPSFQDGKTKVSAHRWSYRFHIGPIGKLWVLHRCDVKHCVNPSHLFLGTALDNNRDRQKKGRSHRGEAHHRTNLKNSDIIKIRNMAINGSLHREIAKIYGMSRASISYIVRKETWKHVSA